MKNILYEYEFSENNFLKKVILRVGANFDTHKIELKMMSAFVKEGSEDEYVNCALKKSFKDKVPQKEIKEDYFNKVFLENIDWSNIDQKIIDSNIPNIKEVWCS